MAKQLQPHVVIVEPELPEAGLELLADLGREASEAAVLVLAQGSQDGLVGDSLKRGARGYLHKTCEPVDLVRAIERVHAGEVLVSSAPATRLAQDLQAPPSLDPRALLTARECEVLRLVAQGCSNAEIGRALSIGEHTVKGHLAAPLRKLALDKRVQLAAFAFEHGVAVPAAPLGLGDGPRPVSIPRPPRNEGLETRPRTVGSPSIPA